MKMSWNITVEISVWFTRMLCLMFLVIVKLTGFPLAKINMPIHCRLSFIHRLYDAVTLLAALTESNKISGSDIKHFLSFTATETI
uniref:Uncharacterized protein n=1 Tax=Octopus bimaculoides TaxID=37653 RepID=A0A0L8GD13_OCTBM